MSRAGAAVSPITARPARPDCGPRYREQVTRAASTDPKPSVHGRGRELLLAAASELFEEVVATESTERGFTDPDLPAAVRAMFAMVLSTSLHHDWMALPDSQETHDRMLAAMTRMAVRGLGAGPTD